MSAINAQRDALQAAWQRREGFALAHLPYVVLAAVAALRAVPIVNGAFRPNGVVLKKYYSIAVVVPPLTAVIHQADLYNLVGVARRLQRATSLAEPLEATFTVHDHQAGGARLATGIVAPSQAAVLTLGAIQPRARVVGDALQIRPTMFASLSYDHRVIDGIVAGQFLSELRRQLETAAFR